MPATLVASSDPIIADDTASASRPPLWMGIVWMLIPAGPVIGAFMNPEPWPVRLLAMLFPAVGLLLIASALRVILEHRKFGRSRVALSTIPGAIGGQLVGTILT